MISSTSYYEGDFVEDKMEGHGIFKWSDAKIYDGEWKNNCLSGYGKITEPHKTFFGQFQNDMKNGFGFCQYNKPRSFLIGKWKDNQLEGLCVLIGEKGNEVFTIINKNKEKKEVKDLAEIIRIKSSNEYFKLMEFFQNNKIE